MLLISALSLFRLPLCVFLAKGERTAKLSFFPFVHQVKRARRRVRQELMYFFVQSASSCRFKSGSRVRTAKGRISEEDSSHLQCERKNERKREREREEWKICSLLGESSVSHGRRIRHQKGNTGVQSESLLTLPLCSYNSYTCKARIRQITRLQVPLGLFLMTGTGA